MNDPAGADGRRIAAPGRALARAGLVLALSLGSAEAADLGAGRRTAGPCADCHGADGNATAPGVPSLAGMPAHYTHWQLNMFRDGRRQGHPKVTPPHDSLGDADMANLSAFYAAQTPAPRPAEIDLARAVAGQPLAQALHCTSCHGPGLMGQQAVPRLAGQDIAYLEKRLRGYKTRTTSDLDGLMTMAAQPLTETDIVALVHFIASLGAHLRPAGPSRLER